MHSGHVSPQYHVVHDDYFSTVPASLDATTWNDLGGVEQWQNLYDTGFERFVPDTDDENGPTVPLHDNWDDQSM